MALIQGWALAEMQGAKLDTPRRLPNLILICEKLFQNAGKSLSAALGDATRQAAFDLFSRARRTDMDLISGHVEQTAKRCAQVAAAGEPIIVAQDTTRLDYFTHRSCQGLGPVGSADSYGLFAHSALALRRDGLPIGVLALKLWARDAEEHGARHRRKQRSLGEKESRIWLETVTAVEKAVDPGVPVILVQDREADLYPFLVQARRPTTQLVVRAYQPRRVELLPDDAAGSRPGGPPRPVYLASAWEQAPVRIAELTVAIQGHPATPQKAATPDREAVVEVRSARVRIWRSQRLKAGECPIESVEMWTVWVRELDPPAEEDGVFWLLLTTLPAGSAAEALRVAEIYAQRWRIEGLHRVLKSGLRVEQFQIDDLASLKNALAVCFVVAWRILNVTFQARVTPDAPAAECLSPSEIAVLEAQYKRRVRTLDEALRLVAKFGGWVGATRKTAPGAQVLWQGFRDLAVAVRVWDLAMRPRRGASLSHDTG